MDKSPKEKCENCGCEISYDDSYVLDGLTICDDCYLEQSHKVIGCNPLAVYSAKRFQEYDGVDGKNRLNEQQKAIYEFVKSRGKVTQKELMERFRLSHVEFSNQFAILRHLELTKGKKEGNKLYIVPF